MLSTVPQHMATFVDLTAFDVCVIVSLVVGIIVGCKVLDAFIYILDAMRNRFFEN